MLVEFGTIQTRNVNHSDPVVTYVNLAHTNDHDAEIDVAALKAHLVEALLTNDGITNFPGSETFMELFHPGGIWSQHSPVPPTWVWCDEDPALATQLAQWHGIPVGRPADVEATHWTNSGPPGVTMSGDVLALIVNNGNDIISRTVGGLTVGFNKATATGATATSLTATGTPFVASAYIGCTVVSLTSGVYGIISANSTSVLTVDRWYNPATPGGAAATTPGATDTYAILSGGPPACFMAISSTNAASVATDTTMAGEITTSGGGLIRALATYAHSASATTYTLANTFTANGSDTVPVTIYRDGLFTSIVNGGTTTMMAETLLNASATLTISGDAVTITHTLTV